MKNNKLTSKNLLLINAGASIAINLFKAVYVFQTVSFTNTSVFTVIYSILAMSIVEFSIIVFLANGKTKDSIGFAVLSVVINLYYFNGLQFEDFRLNVVHVIFSFLLPYISARMAHVYMIRAKEELTKNTENIHEIHERNSDLIKENKKLNSEIEKLMRISEKDVENNNNLMKQVKELTSQIEIVQGYESQQRIKSRNAMRENKNLVKKVGLVHEKLKEVTKLSEKYKESHEKYIELTTCPHCGESGISPKGMSNHVRSCKSNPKSKNYVAPNQLEIK